MRWFQIFWAAWVGVALIVEVVVLVLGIEEATLSEQVWELRERRSGFFSLLIFIMAWMIYHFIRENIGGSDDLPPTPLPP